MISRKDVANNSDNIIPTFRKIMETFNGQVAFGGHLVNPGHRVPDPDGTISAVHPVFRDAADIGIYLYFPSTCLSSSARLEAQDTLTNTIGDMIRAVTPNSAVYSNEVRALFSVVEILLNETGRYQRTKVARRILGSHLPQTTQYQGEV